jgi:hypothetical protein
VEGRAGNGGGAVEVKEPVAPIADSPSSAILGPVVERVLNDLQTTRENCALSFDSGKLLPVPANITIDTLTNPSAQPVAVTWARDNQVDAVALVTIDAGKIVKCGLLCPGLVVLRANNPEWVWDSPTPRELKEEFDKAMHEWKELPHIAEVTSDGNFPANYMILDTRTHRRGVMQIMGVADNPRGVKIRYRLVEGAAVKKTSQAAQPTVPKSSAGAEPASAPATFESWSYTPRYLTEAKFIDGQKAAKGDRAELSEGTSFKYEAGVITLTGPRDRVRLAATMLRVLDQPEVKNPLELPILNMPPDFFLRIAWPSLMLQDDFAKSPFTDALRESLTSEGITAPQLARALSAHVLELEKARFVNNGAPFESIVHSPGASIFYEATVPCADQPDKPLTPAHPAHHAAGRHALVFRGVCAMADRRSEEAIEGAAPRCDRKFACKNARGSIV